MALPLEALTKYLQFWIGDVSTMFLYWLFIFEGTYSRACLEVVCSFTHYSGSFVGKGGFKTHSMHLVLFFSMYKSLLVLLKIFLYFTWYLQK